MTSVLRVLIGAVALAIAGVASAQDPAKAPVAYSIDVRMNPADHTLAGRERVRWRNRTSRPAGELRFHLYFNAWRDAQSTWMREHLTGRSAAAMPAADRGSIDVTGMTLQRASGAVNLLPKHRYIAPDDGNRDDRTVLAVPLDAPVEPGASIDLDIAWHARIPRSIDGIGYVTDFEVLGRWYPQIGVLEESGWNCHQAHVAGGTFADFASYDVRITAPAGWIVGATGIAQPPAAGSGEPIHRFTYDRLTDFAWTASPIFDVRRDHLDTPDVEIALLLQPEHRNQAERHLAAARHAIQRFTEWFGPYPDRRLTIVDPAWQSSAARVAFPMLVFAGTHWRQLDADLEPEAAIAYGVAMQWWGAAIAPDGAAHAWLSQGLSRYATARLMRELIESRPRALGVPADRFFGAFIPFMPRAVPGPADFDVTIIDGYRRFATAAVPARPSFTYPPAAAERISGDKTAVWLETLERYLGWPAVQRMLEAYATRFRFAHPAPADFFQVAAEVSGRDLSWFFDEVYRTADVFDYGVDRIESVAASRDAPLYRTSVVVRRDGDAIFSGTAKRPTGTFQEGDAIEIAVTFADGHIVQERWDGRARFHVLQYESAVPAVSAEVDPRQVLVLDTHRINNSWTLAPRAGAAVRAWSARWMVWLQHFLISYAALV
jgi:hypothetical protein